MNDCRVRKLSQEDLKTVLDWRNSTRIMDLGYTNNKISLVEHMKWFNRIKDDSANCYLLFECRKKRAGLVYFNDINENNGNCKWGFYLGEANLPRKTGSWLGYLGLNYIFENRRVRKVTGEVLGFNHTSLKFFERMGFKQEGCLKKHVLKKDIYTDVYIYSLFADDWAVKWKKEIENYLLNEEQVMEVVS